MSYRRDPVTLCRNRQNMKEQHPLIQRVAHLFGWTDVQLEAALAVLAFTDRLSATRGDVNTVAYLKEANRLFSKAVAGQPERGVIDPAFIGLDRHGYPKLIPRALRRPAVEGSFLDRAIVVVLLSLYREITIPGKLKLWTITTGCHAPDASLFKAVAWSDAVKSFVLQLEKLGYRRPTLDSLVWTGPHITNKKGPNGPAMANSYLDALALSNSAIWQEFQNFVACLSFSEDIGHLHPVNHINRLAAYARRWIPFDAPALKLGKISAKLEPAGKVRLFAIPDYWTQSVMKPLHTHLYEILKLLPTDATFNQQAGVERARLASQSGTKCFWSFDLSAATDRFPVGLQQLLLTELFVDPRAKRFFELWRTILVGRDYTLGRDVREYLKPEESGTESVRYACGQPMGAYSSWASFALAHHCLVQHAARRAGYQGDWWEDYALLGDDIILWGDTPLHSKVAAEYLDLCNLIGVDINLSKSLVSQQGAFEFAKNLVAAGKRLTIFHWKEWDRGLATESGFAEFIKLMISRDYVVTPSRAVLTWLEHRGITLRPRDLSRPFGRLPWHVSRLVILLFSPTGPFPMTVKSWCRVLSSSLKDLGATNVAWNEFPLEGRQVAASPTDHALITFDEDHWLYRDVLWRLWEEAAVKAASTAFHVRKRRAEWIQWIWDDLLDRGAHDIQGELLEALLSIHPVFTESERIWRRLWKDGLPYVYGDLAVGGMQSHDWWIGEDLPDNLGPGALIRLRAERQALPLERYLSSPTPEVQAVSEPNIPKDAEVERLRFRAGMLLRAHKAIGWELTEMDRLRNLKTDASSTETRYGNLQPTTPALREMTTAESIALYEKIERARAEGRNPSRICDL